MTRHVVIGTAGHIDHGKTALVRALTGTDTDRLAEEKRRGITIDLGFAHTTLPGGTSASIVDVPGHEDFIRNMVAGAAGIDVALVVVAADEGVMPQTREHLDVLRMLDVPAAVVALTKADAVDAEWLDLATDELREHLRGTPYDAAPILPVSARTGYGMEPLLIALEAAATGSARARGIDRFRLPVDRGFTVHGTGTVVTGTVRDGAVETGAELRVLPAGRTVRVRGLQLHGEPVARVDAGMRAAVALTGIDREAAARGSWLASADWPLTSMLTVELEIVAATHWEVRQRQRVRLHLGTAEVMARVVLLDGDALRSGDRALAQLRLEAPVIARYGDRFVIRSYSPVTTIGGGRVIEAIAPKRRRLDAERRAMLDALAADPARALPVVVAATGVAGLPLAEIPFRFGPGVAPDDADVVQIGAALYSRARVRDSGAAVEAAVAAWHRHHPLRAGMARAEARSAVAGATPEVADAIIDGLIAADRLRVTDGLLAAPDFTPTADADQADALEQLECSYREAGLAPPRAAELPPALARRPDLHDLLATLQGGGALLPFPPDRLVHRAALADARRRLEQHAGRSGMGPGDFREIFDLPRKHLIPLLEQFDRLGWTLRNGDSRSVAHKSPEAGQPVA